MMNTIQERLTTPVRGEYDIIVVGGGPAGCGAALAAARQGAKTLLVERSLSLGGLWANAFMNPLFDAENKTGIVRELISDLEDRGAWGGFRNISMNNEYLKFLLDQKMAEAGVDVLLETRFSRAVVEEKRLQGVIVENADGRSAYLAKTVFDCTGDGNVAADAGCAFEIGDENGDVSKCQAMTLMFLVGNIPEKYKAGLMLGSVLDECYAKEGKTSPFNQPYLIPVPNSRYGVVQFTHMYGHDPLSQSSLSAAAVEGRRQMIEGFELLKKYAPDFAELDLVASASAMGVRESRRILGDYTLTVDDLLAGESFAPADGVCRVAFNIDVHLPHGGLQECRPVIPYEIPFRCLLPKGYENIVVAGRCISGTHEAMASYRVTGDCCRMGESAGALAAYAIKKGIALRELKVAEALKELRMEV